MDKKEEFNEAGQRIYRYHGDPKEFEMTSGGPDHARQLEDHIEKYAGKISWVYHEIVSDKIHLDVHVIEPTPERPFYFLVTTGMSQRPMHPPPGAEAFAYSELCLGLPADWVMDSKKWDDERHYWPIRALKFLARFPHDYETWLWWGHTIPNGDPPEPIAGTRFTGFLVLSPITLPPEFLELDLGDGRVTHFHSIIPLCTEEMDQKLKGGTESLFEGFEQHGVSEIIDIKRPNTQAKKKRFGFF